MSFDLLVRGGTVVLPETDGVAADIAVADGRIAAVLAPGTAIEAGEILDATGLTVLPGIVDVHLHLGHGKDIARPRVPEDAATETAAAALGGITTFIPYLMATEPFEALFDEVQGGHRGRCPHRLRLSLHHLDRGAACRRAALCARVRRAVVQDLHEQPRRRRRAPRPAGHRRRFPAAAVRGGGRSTAAWSARIRRTSRPPGCCATG